jgi:hypothetical protein
VLLQLKPGETVFLKTLSNIPVEEPWKYYTEGDPIHIDNAWNVEFIEGGPELPQPIKLEKLSSWTNYGDEYEDFSGTARYTTTFKTISTPEKGWRIDLGDVRESARVYVNGTYAGTCFAHPYSLDISDLVVNGENKLEIEVTNLAANRLRALEQSGKEWKKFYEINMVNIHYQKFDATVWDIAPSGLCSNVKLIPLNK